MCQSAIERLEPRRLLANWLDVPFAAPQAASSAIIAPLPAAASPAISIDAAAVRAQLVRFVDLWNGGELGKNGTSGMGTYSTSWDGLFRMNLNRQFNPISYYTNDQTIISQSRGIYINVEAFRNAATADQPRFKSAVQKAADYLLAKSVDPQTYNGSPGGMWWGLQPDGVSPPTHTTQIFGTQPRHKDAYGQVQALFALAQAYSITHDADHLNGAFAQLNVWNTQFADTAAGAGAFLPTANENFSQRVDTRNLDYMTHALEALLTLRDATPQADPRRASLDTQITSIGNFITTRMYRDAAGSTSMGYLPWYYDAQWNPSADPTQRYLTPGHNLEVAFLLSRAVERGFSSNWLNVADKLIAFALKYGFDSSPASPTYGVIRYEKLNLDGTPFNTTPDNLIWWQSSEAARTLLHFTNVRNRTDLADEYAAADAFINARFVDSTYGGWYQSLNPTTLAPTATNKGTVWTGGYHEAMLYAEMVRLGQAKPTPFTGAPIDIPSSGSATIQAENFDNGGEAIAYHDNDSANNGKVYRTNVAVDIQPTTDSGGGYNVGWTRAGEWMIYSVNVASAGTYDIEFRVASPAAGAKFHLEVDGQNLTGAMSVPNTGGWQSWQTIKKSAVSLTAGEHLLRLVMDTAATNGGLGNFNFLRVTRATSSLKTIKSNAAAHVRDGSYAAINYGNNATLEVKKSTAGYNRETYIRFDLASVASIGSAKLRIFGKLDAAGTPITIAAFGTSASWNESSLTWKSRPAAGSQIGTISVNNTTARWYEIDVTSFVSGIL